MAGYRLSLEIATGALSTAQNSLTVAGSNIANVSNPYYSRQSASLAPNHTVVIGGHQYGSGVKVEEIVRSVDLLLEERLLDQKSMLAGSSEGVLYMDNLESLFNIQSDTNVDGLLSDFWGTWHELSNNPEGAAERKVVYESGVLLADYINNLNADVGQLETHLTQELESGVQQVNQILTQIAELNADINHMGTTAAANDQEDSRWKLITELSEYMSVNVIEQQEQAGFVTILTDNGYPLVIGPETYPLEVSQGRVEWLNSDGNPIDISDEIEHGKLSGWLEMKEEVVARAQTELDVLARELIWEVNSLHSQGVGLNYYSTNLTGSYSPAESGALSTLDYGERIDYTKDFKMWVRDNQQPPNATSIEIDMAVSDTTLTYTGGAAGSANTKYNFTVTTSGTVGPGGDNPVITWETIDYSTDPPGAPTPGGSVTIFNTGANNFSVDGMDFTINAGYLTAGNTYSINTGGTNLPNALNITHDQTKRAGSVLDKYTFQVVSGGGDVTGVSTGSPMLIEWNSSYTSGTITLDDPGDLTAEVDGMELNFGGGILYNDETFVIHTNDKGYPEDSAGNLDIETPSTWHWTVDSFKDQFNAKATAAGVSVSAKPTLTGALEFVPTSGYTFAFSDDQAEDSGLMAALGINTYFTGSAANNIGVNSVMADVQKIAAARIEGGDAIGMASNQALPSVPVTIDATNDTFTFEENGVLRTANLPNGTYATKTDLHSLAADIQTAMDTVSLIGAGTYRVEYDEIDDQFIISEYDASGLTSLKVFWDLNPNTAATLGFKNEEATFIPPNGDYGVSNNTNSLLISDAQYQKKSVSKWTFERGTTAVSEVVVTYSEEYYHTMISSLGVSSAEFHQREEFGEVMVGQMQEKRDSISAVSLDEEMVDLMLFQQAYTAASKLITTVDEMLTTLLGVR